MALINRVTRLFQADMHAVLDRIEEPEQLLKQAIREMEDAQALDEQRCKLLTHEHAQLLTRSGDNERALHEIEEELDACFIAGKEELTRSVIRRKLEAQRYAQFLSRKREAVQAALRDLTARLEENRTRLESMRQKAQLLATETGAGRPEDNWSSPDMSVRDEEVEVALLREQQKRRPS